MAEWRVGRSVGRTLYLDGKLVGLVDTAELAAEIVQVMNRVGRLLDEVQAAHPVRCDATTTALFAVLVEPGHVHRCVHPARRPSAPGRYDHRCECGTEWTEAQQPPDAQRRSETTPNDPFVCPTCRDIVPRRRFDSLGRHPRSGEETLCDGFAVWRHDASRVDPYDTTKGGVTDG